MIIGRTSGLLVIAALVLVGCSTSESGSGSTVTGSRASSTATSAPSSGPSAPSSGPSAPASTAHSLPSGKYVRTAVSTPSGDPVYVDWCTALGTDFVQPTGLKLDASGLQFPPGCVGALRKGKVEEAAIGLIIDDPSIEREPLPPVKQTVTVNGLSVEKFGLSSGVCPRLVKTGPVDAIIEGIRSKTSATSPVLCQAADLAVVRFTTLYKQSDLPKLPLPTPSFTDFDLCKVAQATSTSPIPKFGTAQYLPTSLGLTCSVRAKQYYYTLQVGRVPDLVGHTFDKTTKVGTHTLQADNANTHLQCEFYDIGPKIAGTQNTHEQLDLTLNAHYGSAQLCGQVATYMGKLLDTAGLR